MPFKRKCRGDYTLLSDTTEKLRSIVMSSNIENSIDSIFQALGPCGTFTKLQIFWMWFGFAPAAVQLLGNIFIGMDNDHRCAAPANESSLLEPFQHYSNLSVKYKECAIQIMSEDTVLQEDSCVYGMAYDKPRDFSFVSQFDLVCDATNLARLTQTLVIIGQAFGAVTGSLLSDRLGRKTVLISFNIGLLVTGMAIAYAPNFTFFALLKFVVGAFQQGVIAVNATMLVELMSVKDRRVGATYNGVFWGVGVCVLALLAYLMKGHDWRTVQMVFSLTSLPFILQWWFIREPLRWLLANGKTDKAVEYIKYAAKVNKKNPEEVVELLQKLNTEVTDDTPSKDSTATDVEAAMTGSRKLSYIDIFRIPRLLLNTLVMWTAWFTSAFGFFAIYLTATTLAGDKYLNFFLTATMEFPSNLLFYYGLNRFGRKIVLVSLFWTLSAGLIGTGIFQSLEQTSTNSVLSIVFSMLAMAGASGCFSLCFAYTPELFPTNIRNQALGISSMISRVGGMLAPFTGVLSERAKWGPGVLIGCLACLVAVLLRFLPETNGRELPQTIEELNNWFKKESETSSSKKEKKKEKSSSDSTT